MLSIRLHRTGKKNSPFFKIIVNDKRRSAASGRFLEELGYYNPIKKEKSLNKERISYWLKQGAQTSDTMHNMLVEAGLIDAKKVFKHKKKKVEAEKK